MRLPDTAVRGLAGDLSGVIAGDGVVGAVGVFDDEGADLAVVVAGPDHHDAGDGAVADPPFRPVQHPRITIAAGSGFQGDHVRAVSGFGQCERPSTWQVAIRGRYRARCSAEPSMAMLVIANPECTAFKRGDAAVTTGQLGGDHPLGQVGQPGAAVPDD